MPNSDQTFMQLAIDLAKKGEGSVEPNPMVGCVIVHDDKVIGSGFHQAYGQAHAEINAIQSLTPDCNLRSILANATVYVTLEPCSHHGKTGPCTDALIEAGVARVVVACLDPNPLVAGTGIKRLETADIKVTTGILEDQSKQVLAPYLKGMKKQKPWMIAKWAMTLDGKIATQTGDSKWISNAQSRMVVHQLRNRVDAIMVGIGTAIADDPMLNARLENANDASTTQQKPALRVIVDSQARLSPESKLAKTAHTLPTLVAVHSSANPKNCERLKSMGCEIFQSEHDHPNDRLEALLTYLSKQQVTNVLVEGGGNLLGSLNDLQEIDEVHCFIGPKIIGGQNATSPIHGLGFDLIINASQLDIQSVQQIGNDIYAIGRTIR